MFLFGEEKYSKNLKLVESEVFGQHKKYLFEIFKISRHKDFRNDSVSLFQLQKSIGEFIFSIEDSLKKTSDDCEKSGINKYDDFNYFAHKRILRICRTIMDGIVWRNLSYKRVWMKMLSNNKRNSLNEDFLGILETIENDFSSDFINIFSDLTETVRVSDVINIDSKCFPVLLEFKKKGKKFFSYQDYLDGKTLSPQMKKLVDIQKNILDARIPRFNAQIIDSDYKIHRYFSEVKKGINISQNKGYKILYLDEILSISIIDVQKFNSKNFSKKELKTILSSPRKKGGNSEQLIISNFDMFFYENNEFLSGIAPYSIFPFSDEISIKLLSGEIIITSYINIDNLIRQYNLKGWVVERKDKQRVEIPRSVKNRSGLFGEEYIEDDFFILRRGEYFQTVSTLEILRIGLEFISMKSFIGFSEEIYQDSLKGGKRYNSHGKMYNFLSDKNIFN